MRVLSLLAAVALALAAGPLPSQGPDLQAPISQTHVVRGDTRPRCAWVSLATLAKRAGREDLAAATERRPGQLRDVREVWDCCRECGLACEVCRRPADLDGFLTWHLACGRPVAVGVMTRQGPHAIIVTHYTREAVGVLDCNDGKPRLLTRAQWAALRPDGLAYCLLADGAEKPREPWADVPRATPPVVPPAVPQPVPLSPVYVHPQARPMPRDCPPGQP